LVLLACGRNWPRQLRVYAQGVSDEVKNLYWTQRRLQEPGFDDQRPPLQRKYVTVWVPEQKQPDSTIIEGHYKVIEVVE
jgi:hypothetical protein